MPLARIAGMRYGALFGARSGRVTPKSERLTNARGRRAARGRPAERGAKPFCNAKMTWESSEPRKRAYALQPPPYPTRPPENPSFPRRRESRILPSLYKGRGRRECGGRGYCSRGAQRAPLSPLIPGARAMPAQAGTYWRIALTAKAPPPPTRPSLPPRHHPLSVGGLPLAARQRLDPPNLSLAAYVLPRPYGLDGIVRQRN